MRKFKWFLLIFIPNNFLPAVAQDIPTLKLESVPFVELACKNRDTADVEIFKMPLETQFFITPNNCDVMDEVTDEMYSRFMACNDDEGKVTNSFLIDVNRKSGEMVATYYLGKGEATKKYDCEKAEKKF